MKLECGRSNEWWREEAIFKETKFDIVLLGSGISDERKLLYVVFLKYII
jgi:hypothetical protein